MKSYNVIKVIIIANTQMEQAEKIPFAQKYGLKYYSFLISQLSFLILAITTRDMFFCLGFIGFYNTIGAFIPSNKDTENETPASQKFHSSNKWLLGPLIVNCLTTPIILYFFWRNYETIIGQSIVNWICGVFSIAFIIGTSIDASHELIHRPEEFCYFISYFNLFFLQFTVYPTEHLQLHHKKVGSKEDPITSPKDLGIYKYFVNALVSAYKFVYRHNKHIFTFCLLATIGYIALVFGAAFREGSGLMKPLFFICISYGSIFLMECVEYIEHYGLIHRKNPSHEPVAEISSWNTKQNGVINWLIFRFQRHSDHHMHAHKIYHTLDLNEKMPLFPFDFVTGIMLCLYTPGWTSMMNPLVDEIIENKPAEKGHFEKVRNIVRNVQIALVVPFILRVSLYCVAKIALS